MNPGTTLAVLVHKDQEDAGFQRITRILRRPLWVTFPAGSLCDWLIVYLIELGRRDSRQHSLNGMVEFLAIRAVKTDSYGPHAIV